MFIPTVNEESMKITLVSLLEIEEQTELANIVKMSKIVYSPQWEFSGIVSDQRKLYVEIKVPVNLKKFAQENIQMLSKCCRDIYENDEDYACSGARIGTRAIVAEEIEYEDKVILLEKDSVYTNFIKYLSGNDRIDALQKNYLYEACATGNQGNILAASVMLGCAAEISLKKLCEAFHIYYQNNHTEKETENFSSKVMKAKTAYIRLDEFTKRAEVHSDLFKSFGFENLKLNFNFLDIIRQTRNDAGHPTGKRLDENEFKTMLGNYQLSLGRYLTAIENLSLPKVNL
ncbi:hypothetical protein [Priestia aryabhattai]|uniref:hypothetical protein n=1 Tax=Priestia aryabhattai TaxID=412384 RepID=UPI0024528BB0|nr:hypothetical protein [Priestia aryabhattai]MDH3111461.1 hypothetical protein [Priestia aryabhattai]MDH3129618.1 hypothetical protein [Priestia aryabhattai]